MENLEVGDCLDSSEDWNVGIPYLGEDVVSEGDDQGESISDFIDRMKGLSIVKEQKVVDDMTGQGEVAMYHRLKGREIKDEEERQRSLIGERVNFERFNEPVSAVRGNFNDVGESEWIFPKLMADKVNVVSDMERCRILLSRGNFDMPSLGVNCILECELYEDLLFPHCIKYAQSGFHLNSYELFLKISLALVHHYVSRDLDDEWPVKIRMKQKITHDQLAYYAALEDPCYQGIPMDGLIYQYRNNFYKIRYRNYINLQVKNDNEYLLVRGVDLTLNTQNELRWAFGSRDVPDVFVAEFWYCNGRYNFSSLRLDLEYPNTEFFRKRLENGDILSMSALKNYIYFQNNGVKDECSLSVSDDILEKFILRELDWVYLPNLHSRSLKEISVWTDGVKYEFFGFVHHVNEPVLAYLVSSKFSQKQKEYFTVCWFQESQLRTRVDIFFVSHCKLRGKIIFVADVKNAIRRRKRKRKRIRE